MLRLPCVVRVTLVQAGQKLVCWAKAELSVAEWTLNWLLWLIAKPLWFDDQGIDATSVGERFDDEAIANNGNDWLERLGSIQGYGWSCEVLDVLLPASSCRKVSTDCSARHSLDLGEQGGRPHQASITIRFKMRFAKIESRHWLYNATVGAGLQLTTRYVTAWWRRYCALSGIFSRRCLGCSSSLMARRCRSAGWWI